jgi:hypothetical protein
MKRRKSSSEVTTGSMITPLITRRTSSRATGFAGFTMARVRRLF